MSNAPNPASAEVAECVRRSLHQILEVKGRRPAFPLPDSTVLIGTSDALLDSMSLVMFFAELEQELQRRWGVSVDLFAGTGLEDNDNAAETLGTITDGILGLLSDHGGVSGTATERGLP